MFEFIRESEQKQLSSWLELWAVVNKPFLLSLCHHTHKHRCAWRDKAQTHSSGLASCCNQQAKSFCHYTHTHTHTQNNININNNNTPYCAHT